MPVVECASNRTSTVRGLINASEDRYTDDTKFMPHRCPYLEAEKTLFDAARLPSGKRRFAAIHDIASRWAPVDSFYIARADHLAETLLFVYNMDAGRFDGPETKPMGPGPTSRAVRSRRPVLVDAADAERGMAFGDTTRRSLTLFHAPLGGKPCEGALGFFSYTADAFSAEALRRFEWLALRVTDLVAREGRSPSVDRERHREEGRRELAEAVVQLLNVQAARTPCPGTVEFLQELQTDVYTLDRVRTPIALPGLAGCDRNERVLALLVARNATQDDIAVRFDTSVSTVKRRQAVLAKKLGLANERAAFVRHLREIEAACRPADLKSVTP